MLKRYNKYNFDNKIAIIIAFSTSYVNKNKMISFIFEDDEIILYTITEKTFLEKLTK